MSESDAAHWRAVAVDALAELSRAQGRLSCALDAVEVLLAVTVPPNTPRIEVEAALIRVAEKLSEARAMKERHER